MSNNLAIGLVITAGVTGAVKGIRSVCNSFKILQDQSLSTSKKMGALAKTGVAGFAALASSVTATIAGNAEGSIVTGPLLSWVGEDGPEAIIPLGSKRRDRGMDLWLQAGRALGVKEYAEGGMVGDVPLSGDSSDSPSGNSGSNGDKGQIVVNMNPVFNINGEGGNDTVNSIKEKLKELINEMSGELASRLLESYANMPT